MEVKFSEIKLYNQWMYRSNPQCTSMLKFLYANQLDYSVYDIMNLTASRFLSYLVCQFSKGTLLDNKRVHPKGG